MPSANLYSRCVGRNECCRDSILVLVANKVLRIVQFESEPENRRYRGKGDVTLVPVEAYSSNGLAIPLALADDTIVDQRCGIRSGLWGGQCKTRYFCARGEAGQVALLLLVGAIVQ